MTGTLLDVEDPAMKKVGKNWLHGAYILGAIYI